MLLTYKQMKYLRKNDDKTFNAKIEEMSDEKKEEIRGFDDLWYEAYGYHLIANYEELEDDR